MLDNGRLLRSSTVAFKGRQPASMDSRAPIVFPPPTLLPKAVTYISVVCAADEGYVMPLATMVFSLIEQLSADCRLRLFVIDGGITPSSREKLCQTIDSSRATIEWITPAQGLIQRVSQLKTSGHIGISAYYRILIPELLPQDIEKVLYLDCDLIIRGNLRALWNQDIEDNYLLAVQDMGIETVSSKDGLLNYQALGFSPSQKYFNSGVLLLNLPKWRSTNLAWRTIEYIENNRQFIRFHDQDGLNAMIAGAWGEMHPMWNQTPDIYRNWRNWEESIFSEEIYNAARYAPKIIHFASSEKPWNTFIHPNRALFYHYLDKTPWAGWRFTWWQACQRRSKRVLKKVAKRFA